jgi:hypothetical protein
MFCIQNPHFLSDKHKKPIFHKNFDVFKKMFPYIHVGNTLLFDDTPYKNMFNHLYSATFWNILMAMVGMTIIYINSVSLCVCDGGFGGWGKGEAGEATGDLSATGNRFHFLINCCISLWTQFVCVSRERESEVLKPRSLLIKLSPQTRGPKNYSGPRVLTSYFYVRFRAATAGGPYFLLLLLRPFPRSNCKRSLLLTFIFTSVSTQQLPSSMGEVFLGFGGWVRRFGCAFFGLRV